MRLQRIAAIVALTTTAVLIPPWQGAFDRLGSTSLLPVPSASTTPASTTLALLKAGVWWRAEPDYSYFLVFHELFARRSPVPLITPMGPWAFLFRGWHPATQAASLIAWVLLAAGFWLGAWVSARTSIRDEWMRALWFAALLIVTLANPRDTILLVLPVMLLLIHEQDDRIAWATGACLTVLSALAALVKSSSLVIAVLVIGACAVIDVFRGRFPRHIAIFVPSFLALYLLAGKTIRSLPLWVEGTAHILLGRWREAWTIDAPWNVIPFLLLAVAVLIIAANEARKNAFRAATIAAAGAMFIKAGMYRADDFHLLISRASVLALLVLFAPRLPRYASAIASVVAVVGVLTAIDAREIARQVTAAAHPVRAARSSRAFFDAELRSIARVTPLPRVQGTVDWLDARQCVAIAHGLAYMPRPIFQTYMAAVPALSRINARWLSGPDAPQWLVFESLPIDDHYPSIEDSLSWPEHLTRYELAGGLRDVVLLRRRAAPRQWFSTPVASFNVEMDRMVAMPATGLLWASFEVRPTRIGRLQSAFTGLPPIFVDVVLENGMRRHYRIIPAMAEEGFLFSPLVANARAYAALSVGRADLLRPLDVRSFRLSTKDPESFEKEVEVHFARVAF